MIKKLKAKNLSFTNSSILMEGLELSLFMGNTLSVLSATNGQFFVWGANQYFNFKSNKVIQTWPQEYTVQKNDFIIDVSIGNSHVGFLTNSGNLIMKGDNNEGQLGKKGYFVRRPEFDLKNHERIDQIHCTHYVSSAKTNISRIFIWGRDEQGYSDYKVSKIVKPLDVTNAFQLTKDETVTTYQILNREGSSGYQWLFVINQKYLYALEDGKRTSLLPLFDKHSFSAILKLKSISDTHVILTDKNELFLWGKDWYREGHYLNQTILINTLVDNEKIIDFAMNDQMLVFLTKSNQIYLYGHPHPWPGSIERWKLFTFNPKWEPIDLPKDPIPHRLTQALPLDPNERIIQVACNDDCIGVVTSNQRVFMWGSNSNGLYGDRSTKNREIPYEVIVPFINFDLFTKE